jgi:site-specific DNA-adenine methylase
MTNIELSILKSITTELCDAINTLTDAVREMRDELRTLQDSRAEGMTGREYVLVPPPHEPLPGPSL